MANIVSKKTRNDWPPRRSGMVGLRATIGRERGQALVELALLMPIFLLLIVGAAEFGRLAYAAVEVSNAARAGVAYAARSRSAASDAPGIQLAATQDAPDVSGITATSTNICACSDGTSVTCANVGTSCLSPARIIDYVQVNTIASVDPLFHYPGFSSPLTLRGQAIMRVADQ